MHITKSIEMKPTELLFFLKHVHSCTKKEILQYIDEVVAVDGTWHHPLLLFRALFTAKELSFVWEYSESVKKLLQKTQTELQEGYHVGLGETLEYPKVFFEMLEVSVDDCFLKKEVIRSFFEGSVYGTFMRSCVKEARQNFEDWQ